MGRIVLLPQILALCPRNCYCTRYWTKCSNAKLHGLPQEIRNTTEELVTEWDNITEITQQLLHHTGLARLNVLLFNHTRTLNMEENAFRGVSQIKSLTISNNRIKRIRRGALKFLNMLTRLSFCNNAIVSLPSRTSEGLTLLTYLDLSNNRIKGLSRGTFDGMRHVGNCEPTEAETDLPQFQSFLDLSHNRIEHIDPGTFLGLCIFTDLNLHNNKLSVLQPDTF
jgi:Leucine-rich repeat (LRR) protein